MKRLNQALFLIIILSFGYSTVYSCSCVHTSLTKRFKKAKVIFIGEITSIEDGKERNIQNYKKGLPVLEIIKSWKGVKKDYIAIDFADFPKSSGNCPILYQFEEDKQYLVFAYGNDLKVEVECSDTRALKTKNDYTSKEINRLNSFWFRFWARVKPF